MKPRSFMAILVASSLLGSSFQCVSAEGSADLSEQLVAMGTADQAIRAKIGPILASGKLQTDEMNAGAREIEAVDARNLADLRKIIERHGWPDVKIVGVDASNSAFLILQHGPLEDQKQLLPLFREAALAGKARRADLAMLEDRILVREGKRQRYGTQITAGPDGKPRVDPIEDPQNLNGRRTAVGLPSMDEYLDHMEAQMGRAIDRSALTVESEE